MRRVNFTADDLAAIAFERYHHPEPFIQRKMEVLWLKHQGLMHKDIARLAGVSRSSVQRHLRDFLSGGLEAIRCYPWKGQRGDLDDHRVSLEDYFRQHPPRSVKEAQHVIAQRTGLHRGPTQVRRFLRRLGLSPRRVAAVPVPPKATTEAHARTQRRFLGDELEPVLAEARAGRRDVYFVDGAHFVYAAFLGWVWCVARFFVRAASGRKRYNVLGALHAISHRLIRVANHSYLNAESVCDLLRAVAAGGVGRPITVVLDNARYQKCALVQGLARSLGVTLLYLPGYSPNLNLIERVWKFVKKECLRATYHATYEQFTEAIDQCVGGLTTTHRQQMDSLLTHNFQIFDSVPMLAA
ncbi:MAG TPA: IS630 family transposase [Gemmataceae bacterium]|nr:IS630 family transposase [Gemmataceae bacterium]